MRIGEGQVLGGQLAAVTLELQMGVHPSLHLDDFERFGHVIHGAQRKPLDLLVHVGQGGEKNDGNVTGVCVAL